MNRKEGRNGTNGLKKSQKRKCRGCKALEYHRWSCELGVKIKNIAPLNSILKEFIPMESCYKPTTTKNLVLAMKLAREERCVDEVTVETGG